MAGCWMAGRLAGILRGRVAGCRVAADDERGAGWESEGTKND